MAGGKPSPRRPSRGPFGLVYPVALTIVLVSPPASASASNWALALSAGSKAQAQAAPAPGAPGGAAAACVSASGKDVTVTWSAVAGASSYTVYDSTTSATGTYTSKAAGQTGTSWTGTLTNGHYWFEVAAYQGTHWTSAKSAPTGETTVASSTPECTQP
jgi:cellulose 1,4-beta-cellobiosidase